MDGAFEGLLDGTLLLLGMDDGTWEGENANDFPPPQAQQATAAVYPYTPSTADDEVKVHKLAELSKNPQSKPSISQPGTFSQVDGDTDGMVEGVLVGLTELLIVPPHMQQASRTVFPLNAVFAKSLFVQRNS